MKIKTSASVNLVVEYFFKKGVETVGEDWELLRKYKNFSDKTCRDFFHKTKEIRCIFVFDEDTGEHEIIENENFEYFLIKEKETERVIFNYLPVLSVDGIVFYFETKKNIESGNCLGDEDVIKYREFFKKKLLKIFPEVDVVSLGDKLFFSFIGGDYVVILNKLESENIKFNINLYKYLNADLFKLFITDTSGLIFDNFNDEKISEGQAIKNILAIFSKRKNLNECDFAELRFLLKKVGLEEISALKKVVSTFKEGKKSMVINIFHNEIDSKRERGVINEYLYGGG